MSATLIAIANGKPVGVLSYERDRLSFAYEEQWQRDPASFPLSLSMPLTALEHSHRVVHPFLWGLLPDNRGVLREWGKLYQVSDANPFRLLHHVGEECAGAVQFVPEKRAGKWLSGNAPSGVTWLEQAEFESRIQDLAVNHAGARRLGDEGHFSLAGAQPKTALLHDPVKNRWGIPRGATPTTHILKPDTGKFNGLDLNEHFCLRLAERLGLRTAHSRIETIGGIPVIIVERYDRIRHAGETLRVHQEDMCQALGTMPDVKYQNQGGPSAGDIFSLIRNHSSAPSEDVARFTDALIYNFLIGGTDAHAKNFSMLLGAAGKTRLAPLYDMASCRPYPNRVPYRKAKMPMKIGGEYKRWKIGPGYWEKAITEWKLPRAPMFERIIRLAGEIQPLADAVAAELSGGLGKKDKLMLNTLTETLIKESEKSRQLFSQS